MRHACALVTAHHRSGYTIRAGEREFLARVSGKYMAASSGRPDYPVAGDFVSVRFEGEAAVIEKLLPRKSLLARKKPGAGNETQPIAANVDMVFSVMGLDGNFNPRRLERLLAAAAGSGAECAVILTKRDLLPAPQLEEKIRLARPSCGNAPLFCASGLTGEGVAGIRAAISEKTVCFIGSSGVGKSALINRLLGEEAAKTGPARPNDCRGRHTTTARQMYFLPGGGAVIDTPGVREMGLLEERTAGVSEVFPDIEEAALNCRFTSCHHEDEAGCAVKAAVESGAITAERYSSYMKLKRETAPPPEYLRRKMLRLRRQGGGC
ncbi:MAG: ribosome small subunit-dependent GTPase A [Elusimicrobiales bacterium]